MRPQEMNKVVNGKRYNTETAELLAGNDYWDGHNFERSGRNSFLYRTKKGNYFAVHLTCWQGEIDTLEPLSISEAQELFESLSEQRVDYDEAFPNAIAEEA